MGPILQFIRPHDVFEAETLTILSDAFNKAIASLQDNGQPYRSQTMAIRILNLAAKGARPVQSSARVRSGYRSIEFVLDASDSDDEIFCSAFMTLIRLASRS
jgi:hypothetical protein